ncbi:MAG TPA: oligosaccharide flippase family protein [bacterium]|nr:oligosaccharide flippase family protein [bacterium]
MRASGILLAGSVASKALRFGSDVLVGRMLGATGFGVIAAAMSLVGILGEIALLGTQRAALRFASLTQTDSTSLVRRAMFVPICIGSAMALAITLARVPLTHLFFGESVSVWLLPAFSLAIPAIGIFSIQQFAARARKRFFADTLIGDVCRMGLPFAGTAIGFAIHPSVWSAAWGFIAGSIATACVGMAATPAVFRGRRSDSVTKFRDLMRVALPLSLGSSSILLMNELDKVMLSAFRPESDVGVYNAAFRIARQILLVMPALNAAISPYVAPLLAQGRTQELRDLYRRTVRWSLAAGWSATLLFCGFAGDFLGVFGDDFQAGRHILIVICLGHLVNAAAGTVSVVLQYSGNERKELFNGLLVIGASVGLNTLLIPRFGATGAAYSSFLALALVNVLRMLQVWKILEFKPYDKKTLWVLGAGCAGFLLGWGLRAIAWSIGWTSCGVGVMAATAGMAAGWVVYFLLAGVSAEEAKLLRLPQKFIRFRPAEASWGFFFDRRSRSPECDTKSLPLHRSASKDKLPHHS